MAEQKTTEQKIDELDKKIEQIKAQKRAILNREKKALKKARDHRLIQIGAEVESICGEITDLEAFKNYLIKYKTFIKKTQEKAEPVEQTSSYRSVIDDVIGDTLPTSANLDYLKESNY